MNTARECVLKPTLSVTKTVTANTTLHTIPKHNPTKRNLQIWKKRTRNCCPLKRGSISFFLSRSDKKYTHRRPLRSSALDTTVVTSSRCWRTRPHVLYLPVREGYNRKYIYIQITCSQLVYIYTTNPTFSGPCSRRRWPEWRRQSWTTVKPNLK